MPLECVVLSKYIFSRGRIGGEMPATKFIDQVRIALVRSGECGGCFPTFLVESGMWMCLDFNEIVLVLKCENFL